VIVPAERAVVLARRPNVVLRAKQGECERQPHSRKGLGHSHDVRAKAHVLEAEKAARAAINSPLLDGVSIRGARNVLVNISAGANLGMRETTTATNIIHDEAGENAEIILGTVLDENFGDEIRVTVIATGFDLAEDRTTAKVASKSESPLNKAAENAQVQMKQSEKKPDVPNRFSRNSGDYYKGENNLKRLDTPSYLRRDINVRKEQNHAEDPEFYDDSEKTDAKDNIAPFQSRTERIRKDDTDQPAFLRKIMD